MKSLYLVEESVVKEALNPDSDSKIWELFESGPIQRLRGETCELRVGLAGLLREYVFFDTRLHRINGVLTDSRIYIPVEIVEEIVEE